MATSTISTIGLYLVNGIAGNEGTPGAPILHFSLLVNAASGKVSGQAEVTQALAAPYDKIHIGNITGQILGAGFGDITQLVALKGEAIVSFPPPAIGSYVESFTASFAINGEWNGRGGWVLGNQKIDDVPVHKVD